MPTNTCQHFVKKGPNYAQHAAAPWMSTIFGHRQSEAARLENWAKILDGNFNL